MKDLARIILNPFTDSVVLEFHMIVILHGDVVGPVHTSFIVILNSGKIRVVREWTTDSSKTVSKISCSHSDLTVALISALHKLNDVLSW